VEKTYGVTKMFSLLKDYLVLLRKISPRAIGIGIALYLISGHAFAAGISLAWNAPTTGPAPTGYKVYYGTGSGSYGAPINVGNVTSYTVANLTAGATYYFALKSYGAAGNQSAAFSNEVSATVPVSGMLTVDFTASPGTSLTRGQSVTFTPTVKPSTATINSWSWGFGNGSTSTGQIPTISYGSAGKYTVTLTVTDSTGQSAIAKGTNMIKITGQAALPPPSGSGFTLSANKTGNGSIVSLAPNAGIVCGSTCQANFPVDRWVTLMAVPEQGNTFTGWKGACSGRSTSCNVWMGTAQTVSAEFKNTYSLVLPAINMLLE
jgi:PKD repeat protein